MTISGGTRNPKVADAGDRRVSESRDPTYVLRLYVTGQSVRSERAINSLRQICEQLGPRAEMAVVDVLERPQAAEDERILATPTVVRQWPLPPRRVIGDLTDVEKVLMALDLPTRSSQQTPVDDGQLS
jgi:circadian clock protein KaiB